VEISIGPWKFQLGRGNFKRINNHMAAQRAYLLSDGLREAFWARCPPNFRELVAAGYDGCIVMTPVRKNKHTGIRASVGFERRKYIAARLSYAIHNNGGADVFATSLLIRHTCDNGPCVNPKHLTLGTAADNSKDMVERQRSAHHDAIRLTTQLIEQVRAAMWLGMKDQQLREKFNLRQRQVREIRAKHTAVKIDHLMWKKPTRVPD
jgi:hypothetical protein